ncbi:MAG: HEAT repeat domain-containing protein [Chloroflexota bacterium]
MPQEFKEFLINVISFAKNSPLFQELQRGIDTLDSMGVNSTSDLLELLQSKETDLTLRRQIVSLLTLIGYQPAIPFLIEIAQNKEEDSSIRRSALVNLTTFDREKAFQILSDLALFDSNTQIREMTISILHLVPIEPCVDLLLKILQSDTEPLIRSQAIHAIGLITIPYSLIAVGTLMLILDDENEVSVVRAYAAEVLGLLKYQPAASHIVKYLGDVSPSVRYMCAYSLGLLGNKSQIPLLENLTSDEAVFEGWGTVADAAKEGIEEIIGRNQHDV